MAANTDDPYRNTPSPIDGPASDGFAVTASDTAAFAIAARALYVGVTGDVVVILASGVALTFKAVPAGALLPVRCTQVKATGTTATNILALI